MPVFLQNAIASHSPSIWKITETEEELLSKLYLSSIEDAYLQKITNPQSRLEWLAVRVLANHVLQQEVHIHYEESRAPFLEDAQYNISISHSGAYAGIVFHADLPIGFDVEQIHSRVERVRRKFALQESGFITDTTHLMLVWNAKEALYKWYKKGGLDFNTHLRVMPFTYDQEGCFEAEINCEDVQKKLTCHYKIMDSISSVWVY